MYDIYPSPALARQKGPSLIIIVHTRYISANVAFIPQLVLFCLLQSRLPEKWVLRIENLAELLINGSEVPKASLPPTRLLDPDVQHVRLAAGAVPKIVAKVI